MGPSAATADVRRAVRQCLADVGAGDLALIACSGGADSLALAAAAAFEAPRNGWRAGAVTIDHGLQAGSEVHAAEVAATLASLGLDPVLVVRVDVGSQGGPEAAARTARYAALDGAAAEHEAATVLLGHTRDDQAETVLLGLARGSGARSLAGMAERAGRLRRPLLHLPRATLAAACTDAGLSPWVDPHNTEDRFARVRVRRSVLPVLEAELGPGIGAALARTATLLRDDADALDEWAARATAAAATSPGVLAVQALVGCPPAVRRRVLRAAVLAAGAPATDLSAAHVMAVDRLVTGWHGQGPLDLPGGVTAARVGASIQLRPAP